MSALAHNIDRAFDALSFLDPSVGRSEWMRICMAAKAAGLSCDDFNDWSAQASNYGGRRDTIAAWNSVKPGGGVNAGTLFYMARKAGWTDPANDNPLSRFTRQAAPPDAPPRFNAPPAHIAQLWDDAAPATADHPYIVRKRGSPDGLRVVRGATEGWGPYRGENLDGWLIVPARGPTGEPTSFQFIAPDGRKLNPPGCKMAGTFAVGALEPGKRACIGEGIGHAWSLNAVTGGAAIVAFGASNIERAALMASNAGAQPVIVPDRGQEDAAAKAATRVGCAYATLPSDLEPGADVNDLHIERGAEAVLAVLDGAVTPLPANDNPGRDESRRSRQQKENERLQELPFSIQPPCMTVEDMEGDCVWIASGGYVGRISNPKQVLLFKEFADLTASSATEVCDPDGQTKPRKVPNAALWKKSPERKTVDTRTFHAGAHVICTDPEGATALNSWRPFERRPATRDIAPFIEQVSYLFSDPVERDAFLAWLAHIEQRPGVLPHYGWLQIAASTGTGRNWLASLLARLWRGCVAPNVDLPALLESQFNGSIAGRILAIVDEVQEGGGENPFRHVNRLKSLVNAECRDINPKFGRQYREHNACRWLVFSNHDNALPLNDTDRRWRVVRHNAPPRSPGDYAKLYALLDDPEFINAVGVYLRGLDISTFNPGERPPMNDAKRAAISASKSLMQQTADQLAEHWPADVITNGAVAEALGGAQDERFTPAMRRAMSDAGAIPYQGGKPVKVQGTSAKCWILRNADRWADAPPIRVATEAAKVCGSAMDVLARGTEGSDYGESPF